MRESALTARALGRSRPEPVSACRQYADLAHTDGFELLYFDEDPEFSACIDGLLLIDLHRSACCETRAPQAIDNACAGEYLGRLGARKPAP
ncbi:MAG: hypothetical protein ACYCPE_00940 [Metallibacterium sp.]